MDWIIWIIVLLVIVGVVPGIMFRLSTGFRKNFPVNRIAGRPPCVASRRDFDPDNTFRGNQNILPAER